MIERTTLDRRGLLIGAAAVPLALPSLGLEAEDDDFDLYVARMTAETCRALRAFSLDQCPAMPEGPVTLDCGSH